MRIYQIKTGILPIPPNGHGAVEKIIWEYYINFNNMGHVCDIEYLDYIDTEHDVVHVHVANLAMLAHERGIPYYFTCHDHHAYLYGKDSDVFKENYNAIKHSIHSFVPAKFLVDYFDLPNLTYLNHGVNLDFFKFKEKSNPIHKLLCVANNGFIHDQSEDRKGFKFAIEAAKSLDLPITIVGPKNNEKFFEYNKFEYDKLDIKYDLTEDELLEVYNEHTIFLHPSILEAGHPNLTLLESLSCGLPIVGTYEKNNSLEGMIRVERNTNQISNAILEIINNYTEFQSIIKNTIKNYRWKSVCDTLLTYYKSNMKNELLSSYNSTKINHKNEREIKNKLSVNFNCGPMVEITGDINTTYNVKFKKRGHGIVHEDVISNNMWTKCNTRYYFECDIEILDMTTGKILDYSLDLKNKRVKIINESPSLGDNIAWMPVVDKFQKTHECEVHYFTPLKDLYESEYENIKFVDYNSNSDELFYATYKIGCFDDSHLSPKNYRSGNLQSVTADILGLSMTETKPNIFIKNKNRMLNDKYVCISTASTTGCKHWQNKNGWQNVVDYLNNMGYKVVVVQKEPLDYMDNKMLNDVIHPTITNIHDAISWLSNCEFFIGLSSGFSWVSWALNKDVVLISGFSKVNTEFNTPYRVINESVCHGCWNNTNHNFDKNDWMWCPENKNFECTTEISFDMVKDKIDEILKKN
jgi:autotransporter strand-loop-strand O-heptosyltransferase